MARRADGRVNSTDRTKRYTPDTFEDGSAVRRLAAQPQEAPKEARPLKSGVSSQTRRNRARATQISAGYAVFLAIVCTLCIAACVAYVKLQTVVTTQAEDITSKEKELMALIESAITARTKVILPVHLYGQTADMDPILEIAAQNKITVIEDAAQAHGAEYKGRRVGSLGDMACFSFYPGKNLGACGEAGIVVTDNPEYNRTLRMLRDWGAEKKYEHILKGYNYRMEGIQGAVLRVKLRYIEQWTEERRSVANRYNEHFLGSSVVAPQERDQVRHVYHIYAIRSTNRSEWQAVLSAKGIQTGIHYSTPVHLLPAFNDLGYKAGDFPHAEFAAEQELSLPMFPGLSVAQCESVARSVLELSNQ